MFQFIRGILYSYFLINIYNVSNVWIFAGFAFTFVLIELTYFIATQTDNTLAEIMEIAKIVQTKLERNDALLTGISGEFSRFPNGVGFSSTAFTEEEEELVDSIKGGEGQKAAESAREFLHMRCENPSIDFQRFPPPMVLMIAKELIEAIEVGKDFTKRNSDDWDDLLNDN